MSDLGVARGRVVIDTSQLPQAVGQVQAAGRAMTQALGALGIAAGARQFADFVVQADALATSFRRQSVAARELAGSQGNLNQLLKVYDQATGGVIGKAQALSDVTRLLAVGFADTNEELDTFVRAVRGISLATGRTQEFVVTQLQLELLNQTGFRLDQIGLGMEEVRNKAAALQAANRGLTQEQAYQAAVLETANQKFGKLTRSAEAQATGIEKLRKAWADFTLQVGGSGAGDNSGVNVIFEGWAHDIERATNEIRIFLEFLERVERLGRQFRFDIGLSPLSPGTEDAIARARARGPAPHSRFSDRPTDGGSAFSAEQTAAIEQWSRDVAEIERNAARDRLEATRQYESQRTSIIRDYERTIAREAEDFALQRQRAEEDYALSLQRIHRDIGRREVQQAEELERTLADARADAQERTADRLNDLEERIADARATSRERIAELEEDFNRRRERAQRDHNERLRDAAANLDAVRVRELQRDFRNSRKDAQEDLDDRLGDERKNEAKRIADLKKAHDKQTADEKENLEERIKQAQDAHQRQVDAAREADSLRLEDMAADMLLRRTREDEDRAIRLERMREDFEAQLAELASNHLDRIVQINEQEAEELAARNTAFDEAMAALNVYHAGVKEAQIIHQNQSMLLYKQFLDAQEKELASRFAVQGPQPQNPLITPGRFPSLTPSANVQSTVNNRTNSAVIAPSIQIFPAIGQNPQDIAIAVREEVANLLEELFP